MTRIPCSRLFVAAMTAWCISAAASAQPVPPKSLDDIFAPVVVGTPPAHAFNGLFRLSGRDGGPLRFRNLKDGEKAIEPSQVPTAGAPEPAVVKLLDSHGLLLDLVAIE